MSRLGGAGRGRPGAPNIITILPIPVVRVGRIFRTGFGTSGGGRAAAPARRRVTRCNAPEDGGASIARAGANRIPITIRAVEPQ